MFVFLIYSILSLAEFVLCPLTMKQYKVHFENYSHEPILGQREDRLEKKTFSQVSYGRHQICQKLTN